MGFAASASRRCQAQLGLAPDRGNSHALKISSPYFLLAFRFETIISIWFPCTIFSQFVYSPALCHCTRLASVVRPHTTSHLYSLPCDSIIVRRTLTNLEKNKIHTYKCVSSNSKAIPIQLI